MKIFKVIHGYPPRYNAGSEVYSQMLCQGLAKRHQVCVFTRQEDLYQSDFSMHEEYDALDSKVKLYIMNLVSERYRYRYRHKEVDQVFGKLLDQIQPDIVHIGHLNHLSTSIVTQIHQRNIPVVYTLHDYWLMCLRGQFMQRNGKSPDDLWPVCDGQTNFKCATHCYAGLISGGSDHENELRYWEQWIGARMEHIHNIVDLVDHFIAPSKYLHNRFIRDFKISASKISYLDYGFDLARFAVSRKRVAGELFTFGYIGTHIPAKGVQDLIRAFGNINENCQLRIWGRETANTTALKSIVKTLSPILQKKIQWCGEYINNDIVKNVFNHVDCIVVPSIWVENSPLVIHEALQARVPVVTADIGGMSEYIKHEINGLLFKHRDIQSLTEQMRRCINEPALLTKIANRGYLASLTGDIINMDEHLDQIESLYHQVISNRSSTNANSRSVAHHV